MSSSEGFKRFCSINGIEFLLVLEIRGGHLFSRTEVARPGKPGGVFEGFLELNSGL